MNEENVTEEQARAAFERIKMLCREHVDRMRDEYAHDLHENGVDDMRAYTTATRRLTVLIENGTLDVNGLVGLVAFAVRRLSYHRPMMARSDN